MSDSKAQLPKRSQKALNEVLNYLCDEKSDFEMRGKPRGHIYLSIQELEKYLEG